MIEKFVVTRKGIHGDETGAKQRYGRSKKDPVNAGPIVAADKITVEFGEKGGHGN